MRPKQFGTCYFCNCVYKKRRFTSKFCSRFCQNKSMWQQGILKAKERSGKTLVCPVCKNNFYVRLSRATKKKAKYCSRSCLAKDLLPNYIPIYGFKKSSRPPKKYLTAISFGRQTRLHRAIMEAHLGRRLKKEEHIHHKDGDPSNNSLDNLMIVSNSEHGKLSYLERLDLD